jgi:hypothetical protein
MPIDLPPLLDLYVKAENAGDIEAFSQCFAADAVVRDEGRSHQGQAAIRAWIMEAKKKYNHTVEPLELEDRDGKTVLKARVSGSFPGSPVTLASTFVIADGKIASLEIG